MNLFADACDKKGMGFASFNTRGHDMVTGFHMIDIPNTYRTIGAGYEKFEECVYDIDAAISYLASQGFSEVVLVGHSTGANKACYYAATQKDPRVAGVVLSGPLSDRLSPEVIIPWYKILYLKFLVSLGKGDKLIMGTEFFPGTPKRFLSLLSPGSNENIFNYDEKKPLSRLSSIKKPLFVLFGGADEHADRPIEEIRKIFDSHTKSENYKSIIIPAAAHSFEGKEQKAVEEIVSWAKML